MLERPSSDAPWNGTNVSLTDRRDRGISVTLAEPTEWVPSRLCGASCPVPLSRVQPLHLVNAGADVAMRWSPRLLADGGYVVLRVADKLLLPSVITEPVHLAVPAAEPVFPAVDGGAVAGASGDVFYYQVVARCSDGSLGEI